MPSEDHQPGRRRDPASAVETSLADPAPLRAIPHQAPYRNRYRRAPTARSELSRRRPSRRALLRRLERVVQAFPTLEPRERRSRGRELRLRDPEALLELPLPRALGGARRLRRAGRARV